MINTSKYIRQSVIQACSPVKVWSNRVPKNQTTPTLYALITDMSLNEYSRSKQEYEWLIGFNLDCYYVGNLGYDYTTEIDNFLEVVVPKIKDMTNLTVQIKNVDLESSRDLSFDTATNTITRKVLTYSVWCAYQEGVTT